MIFSLHICCKLDTRYRDTRYRGRKQKGSQKPIKSQNQKSDVRRYQGAGRNRRRGRQIKSHKQKADGQAKIKYLSNISRIWLTRSSVQKNDQRSDGFYVQRLRYIYTGESNKLCGSGASKEVLNNLQERKHMGNN